MSHLPQTVISVAAKAYAASGEFVDGRFVVDAGALTKIAEAISPTPRGHFLDAIKDAVSTLKAERGNCQLFALCDRPAVTSVPHPVLGDVPCCERCADRLGA